jgi:hypothetical protein
MAITSTKPASPPRKAGFPSPSTSPSSSSSSSITSSFLPVPDPLLSVLPLVGSALFFALAAYVQLNDPQDDSKAWVLAYASTACVAAYVAQARAGWAPLIHLEAAPFLVFTLILPCGLLCETLPKSAGALLVDGKPFVQWMELEETREALGMLIVLVWLLSALPLALNVRASTSPGVGGGGAGDKADDPAPLKDAAAGGRACPRPSVPTLLFLLGTGAWAAWFVALKRGLLSVDPHCQGAL